MNGLAAFGQQVSVLTRNVPPGAGFLCHKGKGVLGRFRSAPLMGQQGRIEEEGRQLSSGRLDWRASTQREGFCRGTNSGELCQLRFIAQIANAVFRYPSWPRGARLGRDARVRTGHWEPGLANGSRRVVVVQQLLGELGKAGVVANWRRRKHHKLQREMAKVWQRVLLGG